MMTIAHATTLYMYFYVFMIHHYIELTEGRHFTIYNGSSDVFTRELIDRRTALCSQGETSNLQKQFVHIFYCVSSYIGHCRFTIDSSTSGPPNVGKNLSVSFCSKIYLMFIPPGTTLYFIYSLSEHVILINFLAFKFFRTFDDCGPDKVNVLDISIQEKHMYCGRRMPWSILTGGRRADLVVDRSSQKLCRLSVFYTAKHLYQLEGVAEERVWGYPNLNLPKSFAGGIRASTFSLCVSSELKVVAEITWIKQSNSLTVAVYDGPGIYSPCVFVTDFTKPSGNYRASTSAFCIYVVIHHTEIDYEETSLTIKSVSVNAKVCNMRMNERHMIGFVREKSENSKVNFVCTQPIFGEINHFMMFPLLHVIRFIFHGPDTLISTLNQGCDYGGLFLNVFKGRSTFTEKALCNTIKQYALYSDKTKMQLVIVWFKGYSRGELTARIRYRMCPTTYTPILLNVDLSNMTTCHNYVCENTMCKVLQSNHEGPIGPSEVILSAAEDTEYLPIIINVPPRCTNKMYFRAILSKQWIISPDIYVKKINYTSLHNTVLKETFDFLYNATTVMFSCPESPSALLIRLQYCQRDLLLVPHHIILSPPCDTVIKSEINDTINVYSFKTIGAKIEMEFVVNNVSCSCTNYTVTIHELLPEDDTIYIYTARLLTGLSWQTHKNHHGFRLTIQHTNSCLKMCSFILFLTVAKPDPLRSHPLVHHSTG